MPDFDLDSALAQSAQDLHLKCRGTRCKASRLVVVVAGFYTTDPAMVYIVKARCLECAEAGNFFYRLAGLEDPLGYSLEGVDACAYAEEARCPRCNSVEVALDRFDVPRDETPQKEVVSCIGKLEAECDACRHVWIEVYKHEEGDHA